MNPAIFNKMIEGYVCIFRDRNGYNVSDIVVIMSLDCFGDELSFDFFGSVDMSFD